MMQDQALGYDSSNTLPQRWSVWAYGFAGFGLLATIAAILVIANGRNQAAESIATTSFFIVIGYESLASLVGPRSTPDNRRLALSQGMGFGSFAALVFLGICYWLKIWPLADDAPVVFSRSELSAAFWIDILMIQTIPRAYCIWRTSRSAGRN